MSAAVHTIRTRAAVLLAALAASGGCSIVFGVDDECTTSADCQAKGPGLECVEGLCVERGGDGDADTDSDAEPDGDSDVDTDADLDAGPDGDEADAAPPVYPEDLLDGPCSQVAGVPMEEPMRDDDIVLGAIHPYTGQLSLAGPFFEHATVLAVEEINDVGGLEGRRLALVLCDSGDDQATALASAEHLERIGVQAVLGPFSSADVIAVFDQVFHEAEIAIVTAGATSPVMDSISSDGLIWSTSLPAARQAEAIAVHLLEADYQRVAVVNRSDAWGNGMREALQDVYCADGRCEDSGRYFNRFYAPDEDMASALGEVALGLEGFAPDVTVMLTYIEDALVFLGIATGIPTLRSFIWNDSLGDPVAFDLVADDTVLCQVMGTTAAMPVGMVYGDFLINYRARWSDEDPVPYTTNYYDATYLLAYAIAAATAESEDFTGADVGEAMARLSQGVEIEAGSPDFRSGVDLLRASDTSTIDYVGASGDLDFVASTGSVLMPVEAYRLNVDDHALESLGVIYDVDDTYAPPDYSRVKDPACTLFEP